MFHMAGGVQAFDESAIGALGVVAQPVFPGSQGLSMRLAGLRGKGVYWSLKESCSRMMGVSI